MITACSIKSINITQTFIYIPQGYICLIVYGKHEDNKLQITVRDKTLFLLIFKAAHSSTKTSNFIIVLVRTFVDYSA